MSRAAAGIAKLGSLPQEAYDEAERGGKSSKRLLETIDRCHKELGKLSHVNKKALDQFINFNDQRAGLLEKQAPPPCPPSPSSPRSAPETSHAPPRGSPSPS